MTQVREPAGARSTAFPWLFVVALMLAAYHLRAPFVAVAPVAARLRADLGVDGATLGLLTSLPVLCFGLAAPLALLVARRTGADLAVLVCLGAVVVGALVRSSGAFWTAALGTLVLGLGITLGNIVVPVLIRRDVPAVHAGIVTGAYVAVMNVGSMTATLATAPLADAVGWRLTLLLWGLLAILGMLAWGAYLRRRHVRDGLPPRAGSAGDPAGTGPVWANPVAWLLALGFAGQATSYYALTAWLPSVLHDELGLRAAAAGAASSVFQICAIGGAVGVPLLGKLLPGWVTVLVVGVCWIVFPVQLLLAPHLYLLGSVIGGLAQGGGLAALFVAIVAASHTDRESARMSAFVQGTGYVVAALGPAALGLAHDLTGAWTVPLLMVLGTTVLFTLTGTTGSLHAARVVRR